MKKFIIIAVVVALLTALLLGVASEICIPKECSNPKNDKAVLVYYYDHGKYLSYKFQNPETKQFFDISFSYIKGLDDTRDLIKLGDTLNVWYCNETIDYVELEKLLRTLRVEENSPFLEIWR